MFENNIIVDSYHQYYKNNNKINKPSVSKIIGMLDKYAFKIDEICIYGSKIPLECLSRQEDLDVVQQGITRGNHIHSMLESQIKLKEFKQCCDVKSHLESFEFGKKVYNELEQKFPKFATYSEISLEGVDFTGTIDLLMINQNSKELIILDWKSTKYLNKSKECLQLYMYFLLITQQPKFVDYKIYELAVCNLNTNNKKVFKMELFDLELAKIEYELAIKLWKDVNGKEIN